MKVPPASIYLLLAGIVMVVLGGATTYSGYTDSLRLVAVTSTESYTESYTTTSTDTITSRSTQTSVYMMSSTKQVLSRTITLSPPGPGYCGTYRAVSLTLDAGRIQVAYMADRIVSFWMLNSRQWRRWEEITGCSGLQSVPSMVTRISSRSYEGTIDIPSTGVYYFVFLNQGPQTVSITLNIDAGVQTTTVTTMSVKTDYFTTRSVKTSVIPTQAVNVASKQVGFGPVFYIGIALAAGGIGLSVVELGRIKKRESVAGQPALAEVAPRYCTNCGKNVSANAAFCEFCGAAQNVGSPPQP